MKTLIFSLTLLSMTACSKNEALKSIDVVNARIEIDGQVYVIHNESSVNISRGVVPVLETPYIGISGWTSQVSRLSIGLPDVVHPGTFDVSPTSGYGASYQDGSTGGAWIAYYARSGSGTITISEATGNFIKGTFQFDLYSDSSRAIVTNGRFEGDL